MTTHALADPLRHVCGATAHIPDGLVATVLAAAGGGGYAAEDVERNLRCTLQEHPLPVHHALALDGGREPHSVWATWDDRDMAFTLDTLADCPAATGDGGEQCTEFYGHPGGHSWELTDLAAVRGIHLPRT